MNVKNMSNVTCFSVAIAPFSSQQFKTSICHSSRRKLSVKQFPTATVPSQQKSSTRTAVENALLINSVPFLWGSYSPVTKILYDLDPNLPLPLLNLLSYIAAFGSLVAAQSFRESQSSFTSSFKAAFELGSYLYFGSWLNLIALELTSASRAAFLVQLTTAFVPLLDALRGTRLSPQVVTACVIALVGAGVLAIDTEMSSVSTVTETATTTLLGAFNVGDAVAVAAAFCYSVHVIRLQMLSSVTGDPLTLVAGKGLAQILLSAVTILGMYILGDNSSIEYLKIIPSLSTTHLASSAACICWIGAATTALATWAQVVGQQRVGPSRAAVFYATQPVWAVAIATSLGMDKLSVGEIFGGGLIVAAGLTLALAEKVNGNKQK